MTFHVISVDGMSKQWFTTITEASWSQDYDNMYLSGESNKSIQGTSSKSVF